MKENIIAIAEELLGIGVSPCRIEIEWRGPTVANEPLTVESITLDNGSDQIWVRSTTDDGLRVTITRSEIRD